MNVIPPGTTVPLDLMIISSVGGVTGQSPTVLLQRKSDGLYWDGGTGFVVTPTQLPLAEVDPVNQPGLYSRPFSSPINILTSETFVAYYTNANPTYPGNAVDELVFSTQQATVNSLQIAQAVAAKILVNPAIPIDSADIASQALLLEAEEDIDNIEANMALESTLDAFAVNTGNSLSLILSIIQPLIGTNQITFVFTDQNLLPVPGIKVTIKNTTSLITLAVGVSDINGQFTLGLPSGTFNVLFYKPFYSFVTQPYVLTVTTNQTVPITATSFQPTSAIPNVCACYCYLLDAMGQPVVGEMVRAKLVSDFPFSPGTSMLATKKIVEAFSDGTGYVQLNLIQGGTYEISSPALYFTLTNFKVPAVASLDLSLQLPLNS